MQIRIVQTPEEKSDVYQVRKTVFVEEQHVPLEIEIDEYEDDAIHFICYEHKAPIGASRLRILPEYGKLERICVLKSYRGQSIGKQLIKKMETVISSNGKSTAKLNAQTHAIDFYKHLGYEVISDVFDDAGIPHVTMVKHITK